jgi:pterin-4a-carbinolamine dehydratase
MIILKALLNWHGSLLTLNSDIQQIKQGDRHPVSNISTIIDELNSFAQTNSNPNVKIHWEISRDAMGPCLHAVIKFTKSDDCLNFAKAVHDLQEAADHHANFVMDNFHTVNIMLSTHHPVPAITSVDVLFAKYSISLLHLANCSPRGY